MRKRTNRAPVIAGLLAAVVLAASLSVGGSYAKYVKQDTLEGNITVTANLGTITLQEHKAVRQNDGSYVLGAEIVVENSYVLLPGLDVPKDPFVTITKPNDIPVYVYVEVKDELGNNSGITYSLTADWTKLDGVTGKNGGAVYVYKDVVTANAQINILAGNIITVSQDLNHTASGLNLKFYAYMYQAAAGNSGKAVYQHYNP